MDDSNSIKIIQTIASGGTAVLYKAVQTSLDRIVAVKQLHQHLTDDENFTRRFILEAKAAASLDHENIVHVIDFGRVDDRYQIVMEFVEGESLKEVLERWRPIQHDLAVAIVHQICLGLEHAHDKGIVHRDIKPGNVMLTRYGRVKITDFGLAKLTEAASSFTADNSIIGTPLYMSPEQAFGESVDQRSDLFSLGTLLYELLTGKQPFASENYMGVIQNIINKDIPSARELNPDVPVEVDGIVMKALSKDRERRFQTAREFRESIEGYAGIVELSSAGERLKALLERNTQTQVLPRPPGGAERRQNPGGGLRRAAATVLAVALVGASALVVFDPGLVGRLTGARLGEPPPSSFSERSEAVLTPVDVFDVGTLIDDAAVPAAADPGSSASAGADAATAQDTTPLSTATASADSTPVDAAAGSHGGVEEAAEELPSDAPRRPTPRRKGYLLVGASPGAEIYVDGTYRGDSPPALRLELTSGRHSIECRRPGYEPYRESLKITTGEMSRRTVALERLKGMVSLATGEGAQVFVDGALFGVTPIQRPIELDAGSHRLTIKKPGFNEWTTEITVEPKKTLPLKITLSPRY